MTNDNKSYWACPRCGLIERKDGNPIICGEPVSYDLADCKLCGNCEYDYNQMMSEWYYEQEQYDDGY